MDSIHSGRERVDALTARVKLPPLIPASIDGGKGARGREGLRRGEGRAGELWTSPPSIHNQRASRKYFVRRGRGAQTPRVDTRISSATTAVTHNAKPLKFPSVGVPPMT